MIQNIKSQFKWATGTKKRINKMLYLIKFGVSLVFVFMFFMGAKFYSINITEWKFKTSIWHRRFAMFLFGMLAISIACTFYFGFKLLTMRYL